MNSKADHLLAIRRWLATSFDKFARAAFSALGRKRPWTSSDGAKIGISISKFSAKLTRRPGSYGGRLDSA